MADDGLWDTPLGGVILGLICSFGSTLTICLIIVAWWYFRISDQGRILLERFSRPGQFDEEQRFAVEEAEALQTMDPIQKAEYLRAKAFIQANPPESVQTDISLSQYLAIQEKGVSAWEFEPELEIANCFVEARTEIEFFDSECTVMSNLPVPKQNEVYYWEAKIYEKPETTLIAIGMATKPYPLFRLPGFHKSSVAYFSNGDRRFNQPFAPTSGYAHAFVQGDVIGVGYRPRTGSIFFTRNGRRLDEAVFGQKSQNFFPAVGANGPCTVHVNFGQAGFVFIEANVKKWGLAPVTGSLAPPPPYGAEQGSILLETGSKDGFSGPSRAHFHSQSVHAFGGRSLAQDPGHSRSRSGNYRSIPPTSPGPLRSPTDISLAQLVPSDEPGESSNSGGESSGASGQVTAQTAGPSVGLGLPPDVLNRPPPEYTSPESSVVGTDNNGRRDSSESENTPLIHVLNRSRGASVATPRSNRSPPIPSYSDAVRDGAGRTRSNSARPFR